ncbi:Do family serine endopeptidase [Sulfurisoma sediminicola]|uniref:Serine protease DegS/serine protease DegQ n=1 Tax=Sulfurisoma sediminicola TaxID=1381557 RepID=A0A497XAW4_9PROT|nr:Do family serine endopeptidase [Sulfurisoma sediminicola]RLJ63707.1 serine protease DegS/serine protease DegQ [Sulfurisoma sediminicola]
MRRIWLIFAQTVTICVAALFVVQTLKPEWLAPAGVSPGSASLGGVAVREAPVAAESRAAGSYADAAKRAVPAVVHIFTSQEIKAPRHPFLNDPFFRHFFGDRFGEQTQRRSGLGSGVVVSAEGYILTNYHVIEGADEIEVALNDGRKFKAKAIGTDPESDLAVLKIAADSKLPAITFAAADNLRVGDVVLAIGNPFGVGQTVTSGIVSALGRTHLGINTFENFIQTDAAINPGNSGGALVDASGNLVGINTAIYSQSGGSMGIGFAIPVSLVRSVMEQIIKTGTVTRGWVGVEVQEVTPELAESFRLPSTSGALIAGVMRGSPADKAGVKPGDLLLAIDGKPVTDAQVMLGLIAALAPGQEARFNLRRDGKEVALAITIGKRPTPPRE